MQQFKLKSLRSTDKRKSNRTIILSHIGNFSVRLDPMRPELEGYLPYSSARDLDNYYRNIRQESLVPYHYLVNEIKGDWEAIVSSPLNAKSTMITNAVSNGYIDPIYSDAIVIAIQDDYALRVPDERAYQVASYKIIAPIVQMLKMSNPRDSVLWFDEVFDLERYKDDMEADKLAVNYLYKVKPMKYFDRVIFNLALRDFT